MKSKNKGFSLVELIIVVAIMAVLVGVLAPSYIKYVEKSRQTKRLANADTFRKTFETATVDVQGLQHFAIPSSGNFLITNGTLQPSNNPQNDPYNQEIKKVLDTVFTNDYTGIYRISVIYDSSGNSLDMYIGFTEGNKKYDYAYSPLERDSLIRNGYKPIEGSDWLVKTM